MQCKKIEQGLSVCSFTHMSTIDLQENKIKRVFDMSDKSYQILILNRNYLKVVPCDLLPSTLKHLSLDENELQNLEIDMPFPHLQTLSLEMNKLKYLDIQTILPSLHSLNLQKNHIYNLDFLLSLPSLKDLNISYNDVSTIKFLPQTLERFKANFCDVKIIQSRLPPGLQELHLHGNMLRSGSLPMNWGTQLRSLKLGGNNLKEFPKRLPDSLEELGLQYNNITEIPSILPKNLRSLYLDGNRIRILPKTVNVKLDILLVSKNCLTQDLETDPISYARHIFAMENWNKETHHISQTKIKQCWKRYILKKRLRHFYRTHCIISELLMISLHPDRILQTDIFSPEWF